MVKKIADRVNINSVVFNKNVRSKICKAVVTLAPSTGTLCFNDKMTKLLSMRGWKQVLVGTSPAGIIVLKMCEPEEYGAVVMQTRKASAKNAKYSEKIKHTRYISIRHLIKDGQMTLAKAYRAERDGEMIFLEDAKLPREE